ncbi:hypothetical protein PROFUN_11326 [Planoprotostelium fungivorum]|uniref:Uncharacterized protein n=1 Tax=Planoprotostelium fungivorum TaxID=1890364 RepID=A0A2P6NA98_9EUKA|nr:hypothetical protein PROFUN_11326 [Planoprotostelium fungivorum]
MRLCSHLSVDSDNTQCGGPVTERAFHFEDSYILLAIDSKRNTMQGSSLCHNLSCPTKRRQIQCTMPRDPRLGWCILVSSKEKESAWLNNGQQRCKATQLYVGLRGPDCVEHKEMGTSMFVLDAQMIAYFQEDKGSSLEPEAELQSGELCSVK